MSNLIKAGAIRYSEEIRTIDMNDRAESITQEYYESFFDNYAKKPINFDEVAQKLEEEKVITPEDVDFTPGIATEELFLNEEEGNADNLAADLEARLSEKRRKLDEAEAHLQEIGQQTEQIIEEARREAERILEEARQQIEKEKQQILEDAREQGYQQGMEEAEREIADIRSEAEQTKEQYRIDYEKQVEELEPAFVEMIIKYVEKLTGIYSTDKKEIVLHLIESAFKGKPASSSYIIRVSEEDYPLVNYSKDMLNGILGGNAALEVVSDPMLEKNQCLIETESRIFDCSLGVQLAGLIEDIRLLAEKE